MHLDTRVTEEEGIFLSFFLFPLEGGREEGRKEVNYNTGMSCTPWE